MKCRICGNENGNKIYTAREMMFGIRDEFDYFECDACRCLQIKEIPTDMSKYYPEDYYSISAKPPKRHFIKDNLVSMRDDFAILGKGFIGRMLVSFFPAEDLRVISACRLTKKSRILDVGCGAGLLVHRLKNAGFKNVMGVDPYIKNDIKYKNGLVIHKKELSETEGEWDFIMFHHSLEHIPDQQSTLNAVSAKLNKIGTCLIRIPTVSSYAWQHYGVNWVQLDAPRHFYLHSEKSIGFVVKKAELEIKRSLRDSTEFQFWGSEQYIKDIPLNEERSYWKGLEKSVFSREDMVLFKEKARKLNDSNMGDQAVFYLGHKDV